MNRFFRFITVFVCTVSGHICFGHATVSTVEIPSIDQMSREELFMLVENLLPLARQQMQQNAAEFIEPGVLALQTPSTVSSGKLTTEEEFLSFGMAAVNTLGHMIASQDPQVAVQGICSMMGQFLGQIMKQHRKQRAHNDQDEPISPDEEKLLNLLNNLSIVIAQAEEL